MACLTFISIKIQQLQMKILCIKYFQHINKIISIMQPNLIPKAKHSKNSSKFQNQDQTSNDHLLEQELSTLKQNILNLLKYCRGLQDYIKSTKKSLPLPTQILQQNHYEIRSEKISDYQYSGTQDQCEQLGKKNVTSLIQRQNEELKKTRQLYLDSLNKIHQLKNQVLGLTQRLNHLAEEYNTPNKKETALSYKKDLLAKELLMSQDFARTLPTEQEDDIDIETLLCHQDLDMDSPLLKENSSLSSNKEHRMVESLIAKGIEYRDKRLQKSNQFKQLSTIVQRYREESLTKLRPLQMNKHKTTCYR